MIETTLSPQTSSFFRGVPTVDTHPTASLGARGFFNVLTDAMTNPWTDQEAR